MLKPTIDQQKILDHISQNPYNNLIVPAVPGAGKSTLLIFIEQFYKSIGVDDFVALTFSKSLAEDLLGKLTGTVKTVHAKMYEACQQYLYNNNIHPQRGKYSDGTYGPKYVEDELVFKTTIAHLKTYFGFDMFIPKESKKEFFSLQFGIISFVDKMRLKAIDYRNIEEVNKEFGATLSEEIIKLGLEVMEMLTDRFFKRGQFDYAGMIYIPVMFPEVGRLVKSPKILAIDEVNDSYPLLRAAYKIIARDSTVIAVGDEKQAIHMWAGTEVNCMWLMQSQLKAFPMPYETTFRVPKVMCSYLNSSGVDTRIKPYDKNRVGKINQNVSRNKMFSSLQPGDAILGRYNKGRRTKNTLESLSLQLIQARKKVVLLGSSYLEDINFILSILPGIEKSKDKNVTKAQFKTLADKAQLTLETLIAEKMVKDNLEEENFTIKEWRRRLSIFILYHTYYLKTQMLTFSVNNFVSMMKALYSKDADAIQICSMHRSKGKEWKRVYIFDLELLENDVRNEELSYSKRKEAHNLFLVALTRASEEYNIVEYKLPDLLPEPIERIL